MAGPFGSMGGRNTGADNLKYQADLRQYFEDLDARKAQEEADAIAQHAPQLLGGLMADSSMTPDDLAQMAGQTNQYGFVDPRANPALQAVLSGLNDSLQSRNPALQKAALSQLGRVVDSMAPEAPKWRDPLAMMTTDTKNFEFAKAHGFQGSFVDWLKADNESKRQQVTVNNQSPQFENEYDKALGKAQAEEFLSLQNAPRNRAQVLQSMEAIHGLLGDRGGFLGSSLQELKMAADRLGVPIDGLDADQAAKALSNDLALKLRSTGDGGGMPGALSDADRSFLYKQVPSIDFTPEGRAQLIEVHRRLLAREAQVADLARGYAAQHGGRLDAGFYSALTMLRDQPLFDDLHMANGRQTSSSPTPSSGGRITNFRRVN